MFEKAGKIFSFVKWWVKLLLVIAFIIALINLGAKIYPILKDCWTCDVFSDMYDIFGKVGMETFHYFQHYVLIVVSVCLALWVVYKTFEALSPTLDSMLYPDAPKFDENFVKTIYKKIFLTIAILGLFILNEPRNIFANTFEITLDFGSAIGREFVRKKVIKSDSIPEKCQNQSGELVYNEDSVLSENTKDNIVCLMREVNALRHDYINLGIAMFEYGVGPMILTFTEMVLTKVAFFVGGILIGHFGGKLIGKGLGKMAEKLEGKLSKILNKNLGKIGNKISNLTTKLNAAKTPSQRRNFQRQIDSLKKQSAELEENFKKAMDDLKGNLENKAEKKAKKAGRAVGSVGGDAAAIGVGLLSFFTKPEVRTGVGGLCLLIGLTMINVLFGFIIVEYMLFLGITIILLPILVACYIFHDVGGLGSFATKGLSDTFSFALRIIFTCISMVICAEINDWILGGMFTTTLTKNITNPEILIDLLEDGNLDEFNNLVGEWYLIYVLLALYFDFVIVSQSKTFAAWFGATVSDSGLAKPLVSLGKTTLSKVTSATRELKKYHRNYRKTGNTTGGEKGRKIDNFIGNVKNIPGKIKGIPGKIRSKFGGKD